MILFAVEFPDVFCFDGELNASFTACRQPVIIDSVQVHFALLSIFIPSSGETFGR